MKRLAIYILLFIPITAFSQGFDWQYSSRMPSGYPNKFIGATGEISYSVHFGNIPLVDSINNYKDCCNYTGGTGMSTSLGLQAEFWKSGNWAYNFGFMYRTIKGNFNGSRDLPQEIDENNKTIYETVSYKSEVTITSFLLNGGIKYRFSPTHFIVVGSIIFGYQSNLTKNTTMNVVGATLSNGTTFSTNTMSVIKAINPIILMPQLKLGYDFSLGLGVYTTPSISFDIPLMSLTNSGSWRDFSISFGITAYTGLK